MPTRSDPPQTQLLRAFETVARLKSFKMAAVELGITQSAVSQRLATLEMRLGTMLINRSPGQFSLTDHGFAYLQTVRHVLEHLDAAEAVIRASQQTVRLTTTSSIAKLWLAPKLIEFNARCDDINLHIHTSDNVTNVDHSEFDLSLRIMPRQARDGELLTSEDDGLVAIGIPSNSDCAQKRYAKLRLLEDDCRAIRPDVGTLWNNWSKLNGLHDPANLHHTIVQDAALMIDIVRHGGGVGIVRKSLVNEDIQRGDLVCLPGKPLEGFSRTVLLERSVRHRTRAARRVANWILDSVRQI